MDIDKAFDKNSQCMISGCVSYGKHILSFSDENGTSHHIRVCDVHFQPILHATTMTSMGCSALDLEARVRAIDNGRFNALADAVHFNEPCLDCSYFNPKATNSYRCKAMPMCPGDTLKDYVKSYILWKMGVLTESEHMDICDEKMNENDLISALVDHIKLLGQELDDVTGLASVHGWVSSRVEAGKVNRARIKDLCVKVYGRDMEWVQ